MALNTQTLNTSALNATTSVVLSFQTHDASYRSSVDVKQLHLAMYRFFAAKTHNAAWQSHFIFNEHTSIYGFQAQRIHHQAYASQVIAYQEHGASWKYLQSVSQAHAAAWESIDTQTAMGSHTASWSASSAASQVFASHDARWTWTPKIEQAHHSQWKSVVSAMGIHHAKWDGEVVIQNLHTVRYRSNLTTPIITDGLVYVSV